MEKIDTYKKLDIPVIVLLSFITICGLTSITMSFLVCPFVLLVCFKRIRKNNGFYFRSLDWIFLLIYIIEASLLLYSSYMPNSIQSSINILFAICLWFYLRVCIDSRLTFNYYLQLFSIITLILSVVTLLSYIRHRSSFVQMGYEDMTLVRQYYHPLGFISNDWASILLCFLPIPFYSYLNSRYIVLKILHLVGFITINIALLVSFSRGAYLSLLVFYIVCSVYFLSSQNGYKKNFITVVICTTIISLVALIPDREEVITTISISKTTTQQRSIQGRYNKWEEAWELFKQNPIAGVGGGNYGNASVLHGEKNSESLSNRSTNSYFQLMVEKGVIGSILLIAAFLCVMIDSIKTIPKCPTCIPLFASITAFMVREFFFSSFFEEQRLPMMFMIVLFAMLQITYNYDNKYEEIV